MKEYLRVAPEEVPAYRAIGWRVANASYFANHVVSVLLWREIR
jgi:hypothetical protein